MNAILTQYLAESLQKCESDFLKNASEATDSEEVESSRMTMAEYDTDKKEEDKEILNTESDLFFADKKQNSGEMSNESQKTFVQVDNYI